MDNFKQSFIDYVLSGHSILSVETHESERAISQIKLATKEMERQVFTWSIATGWRNQDGEAVEAEQQAPSPEIAIQALSQIDEGTICVLKNFGFYLNYKTYQQSDIVIAWIDEIKPFIANSGQTIVFVGTGLQVPDSLRHDVTEIDFDLPDEKQIEKHVLFACEDVHLADGAKFEPSRDMLPEIVASCKGMTQQQTIDRVALALRKDKDLNKDAVKTILKEKAAIIKSSGLLTYIEPPVGGLSIVGGYEDLKQHVQLDKPCFSQKAREFGIEFPRGVMLVGIPGCGKTLLSLAIASEFGLPLVAMDVGNMMNKYVGESEANMREAIKILERVSPCVLQLDEIEKGFGGNGDLDGGSSKRVFGTFLKWLNDRTSPVYIVATANEVQSLPPEFCRKGRFDEIFGLDLPIITERKEIFKIHLEKRGRAAGNFDIHSLAKDTGGFTGADIEQAVKLALKMAFVNGDRLSHDIVLQAIQSIIPLSKTEPERIKYIRDWCKVRAKQANPQNDKKNPPTGRKVTVSN